MYFKNFTARVFAPFHGAFFPAVKLNSVYVMRLDLVSQLIAKKLLLKLAAVLLKATTNFSSSDHTKVRAKRLCEFRAQNIMREFWCIAK